MWLLYFLANASDEFADFIWPSYYALQWIFKSSLKFVHFDGAYFNANIFISNQKLIETSILWNLACIIYQVKEFHAICCPFYSIIYSSWWHSMLKLKVSTDTSVSVRPSECIFRTVHLHGIFFGHRTLSEYSENITRQSIELRYWHRKQSSKRKKKHGLGERRWCFVNMRV